MKQVIINGKKYQYLVDEYANVYGLHTNLKLRHIIDRNGYHMVKLYSGSKKDTLPIAVHRLVAMMFIPNPKNKKEVHHIDHNHQNNQASNLMWVTDEENIRFEYIDGIEHSKPDQYGENNPSNKYSEEQIHDVCKLLEQNKTLKKLD